MSTKGKERRKFTESERKSYISEYLSSPNNHNGFEKRKGLSQGALYMWMKTYQIEDMKMKRPIIDPQMVDEETAGIIAALRAENKALHKEKRQLQRDLDTVHMPQNSSLIWLKKHTTFRYEKTQMPSNRHLVTERFNQP